MKKINEQKLQAFAIGTMGKRPLSRKEQEEQRKKEEEEAAAHAFKEFVETFEESPSTISKVWVKAGTYDAGSRKEDYREKGKLYKPSPKIADEKNFQSPDFGRSSSNDSKKDSKKKGNEKKKSNLELFKEELRQIQEEREERHKYKSIARQMAHNNDSDGPSHTSSAPSAPFRDHESGSLDNGDPNTTNLYLGNLSPKISEQQLMELFGRYGPLASIKIMWPRSEEEKSRGRNCGFVAYMSRRDAERALKYLNGRDVMGYEMKLGWGKSVPILTHPIYIPQTLMEYAMPPPPSGLPFNAQPIGGEPHSITKEDLLEYIDPEKKEKVDKVLYRTTVKVVIPTERPLLALIHRMIEFVIREGPMFEAMIMHRELENPMFRFLFENESPAHIYYRWKLFSLLQGDTVSEWKQKEFRMFKGGSIWKPPPLNFYTQGMPEELIIDEEAPDTIKGALSNAQRDRLEDLLRHMTPERSKIGDAMIFCIEHAEAADEICECIAESLSNPDTLVRKKIARLYLISDILHNCSVKVANASFFRKAMERNVEDIFRYLNATYKSLDSRLKAEGFKVRVLQVFRAWEDWVVYPKDFLQKLKNIFLGITMKEEDKQKQEDVDGAPLSADEKDDEDLDGIPLDGAALIKGAILRGISGSNSSTVTEKIKSKPIVSNNFHVPDVDDDIDGVPLDEDIDGFPLDKIGGQSGAFVPSKWETVDPAEISAQAITTSKWDTLDPVVPEPPRFSRDSEDSNDANYDLSDIRDLDEERRTRLREVELKAMQYQDELESGEKSLKSGWSIAQQVEHYRRKLIKKELKIVDSDSPREKSRYSDSRSPSPAERRNKKSRRSASPYNRSSPLRSAKRRSRSKSRSPYKRSNRHEDSGSPKSMKSRKRSRSRSNSSSRSPKRSYKRSPSPNYRYGSPARLKKGSPERARSVRDSSPSRYNRSPPRHRTDKHKHKHKY